MSYREIHTATILLTTALAFTSAIKNKHKRVILSKRYLLFVLLIASCLSSFSQHLEWARFSLGNYDGNMGLSITTDAAGNIYTAGYFMDTADFDPGAGTFFMTAAAGYQNIFITKYDAAGNLVWAKSIAGSKWAIVNFIAVDATGNVFTTGFFQDTVDFDPGAGSAILNAGKGRDMFVFKLDTYGNFKWVRNFGDTLHVNGSALATDNSGNVFVTGSFRGTVDFDPSAKTVKLTARGWSDLFILKLDADGNYKWVTNFESKGTEGPSCIATDASGNVYTSCRFFGTIDFDPGPGTFNITSYRDYDIAIIKLTTAGNFIWAKAMQGSQTEDVASLAVDPAGNVYAAGYFMDTVDFDPSTAAFKVQSSGDLDAFVSKLDNNGNFLWVRTIGGQNYDRVDYMSLDGRGNVYFIGWYTGTIDFNPGAGTHFMTNSIQNFAPFICMLNAGGNFVWAHDMNQVIPGYGRPLAVDAAGNIFITGHTGGCNDIDFTPETIQLTHSFGADIFVMKYAGCRVKANVLPSSQICAGSAATLKGSGASTYSWSGNVQNGVPFLPDTAGTYEVTGTDSNGCVCSDSVTTMINPLPKVGFTASANMECAGTPVTLSGTGASIYGWSDGVSNAIPFVPFSTKTYTVTGTDSKGCKNTAVATVNVKPLPVILSQPIEQTAQVNSDVVFTIATAGPGISYQWQVNTGSAFVDLTNSDPYSGVSSNTLMIRSVSPEQNNFKYRCIVKQGDCSDASAEALLHVNNSTGIQQVIHENTFNLYPNPAISIITIQADPAIKGSAFSVTDAQGRLLLSGNLHDAQTTLDISSLAAGIYFVQVHGLNLTPVKMVKQ